MTRFSLRWVLLVPLLATIAVGFVAFAAFVDRSDRATRLAAIDRELTRAERVEVGPAVGGPGGGIAPAPADVTTGVDPPVQLLVSADGEVTAAQGGENPFTPDELAALGALRTATTTDVGDHRVRASPRPDGQVLVTALSLAGYDATTGALRRSLLVGGLVIAALEAAMAWWLAGRLVRPLRTMATTAGQIADGALDTPVPRAGGSREVSDLSADLDRMVVRLRAALAERERSAAQATAARDDMQRFLADVSHEIGTPLTALTGYSQLYERGMLAEPGALDRAMSRVGSESVRLHELVTAMLQLSGGGGTGPPVVADVDVRDVVRAVVDDLGAAHPHRRIDLRSGPDLAPVVPGNQARIHQAVLNLAANACTHTAGHTPITIAVETTAVELTVRVVDHGPGIDETEREDVFLPFYRTDPSRVRYGASGSGLGLAIVRQVADEHGGSVAAGPTPGGGTTFALCLPRGRRDDRGTVRPPRARAPSSSRSTRDPGA